jgi:magnesium transporter
MIRVTLLKDGRLQTGGVELLDGAGGLWVDVEAPTPQELALLAPRFGLHRLEIEDCLHLDQRPKVEEYPGHVFIVVQGFTCEKDVTALTMHELHLFVSDTSLLTVHALPSPAIDQVRTRIAAEPEQTFGRGFDFLAYLLADALVDQSFPLLDAFNDELDQLESSIFEGPEPEQLQRIWTLKRSLMQLRRVLSPQRDTMSLLSRRGLPHIQDRTTLYFRDVHDHLIRVYEQLEASRDVLAAAMEAYLSVMANRTNDVSKQLTIIATVFLPLSFITGFFGQNFDQLSDPFYFWIMIASMVVVPTTLVLWFRSQRWM